MTDTVDKIVIQSETQGVQQTTDQLNKLGEAMDGLTVASQETEKSTGSVDSKFASLERRFGTTSGQASQFEKIQRDVNAAVAANPDLQDRANAVLAVAEQRYNGVSQALQKQRDEMAQLANVQKTVDQTTGVSGSSSTAARGADIVAYGKQLDDLRAKYNPLYAAGQQYKSTLTEINQAAKVGALTATEAAAAIATTKSAFVDQVSVLRGAKGATDELSHAHEGLTGQQQSLLHAVRSGTEGLLAGASTTQIVAQQFGHLSYASSGPGGLTEAFGGLTKTLGGLASGVGAFITPVSVAATAMGALSVGAIAAAVHWSSAQGDIEKALVGIGRQSGITATDINAIGVATSATTKLSIGQATELATAFAATGRVSKEVVGPATQATEGLAKALGVDSADAAKLFAAALADPAKGVAELDAKVGAFNSTTREQIAQAIRMGDVGTAQALMIRGVVVATQDATKANESWADSFSDVWKSLKNGANLLGGDLVKGIQQTRHDLGGSVPTAGESKQSQLASAQTDLANFNLSGKLDNANGATAGLPRTAQVEEVYNAYGKLFTQVEKLKDAIKGEDIAAWNAQLDKMANAAGNDTQALIPQIAQIQKLQGAISDLTRAQNVTSVGGPFSADYSAALIAAQNQLKIVQESKDEAAAYNLNVQEIAASYQGVSTQTALALEHSKNQLTVLQAVGAGAKMAAQYAADFANAMDKGKTATDAAALAADHLTNSSAAAVSAAQLSTQSLKDQNDLRAAGNGLSQIGALQAQQSLAGQQAFNKVMQDTGAEQIAQLAGQNAYNTALKEGLDLEKALLAGQKAYTDSITNGAPAQAATNKEYEVTRGYQQQINTLQQQADASALAWQQNMLGVSAASQQAAQSSQQAATALENAARAAQGASLGAGGDFGSSAVQKGTQYTSTYGFGGIGGTGALPGAPQPTPNTQNLSIDAALAAAKSTTVTGSAGVWVNGFGFIGGTPGGPTTTGPDFNAVSSIYDLKNSQTSNKSVQKANLQEEMAWLQTQPDTVARDQSIVNLQKSIDTLNSSTTTLNGTMQESLSPYYSQDPRTSHIGFRSQGMSDGGYVDVPGSPSANDNMIATVPVASGERLYVDPMNAVRGKSSGSITHNITINVPLSISGSSANKDQIGRTVYQSVQSAARQIQAAGR